MTKKGDISWFQFDLTLACTVTYIEIRIFTVVLLVCIGHLISTAKFHDFGGYSAQSYFPMFNLKVID